MLHHSRHVTSESTRYTGVVLGISLGTIFTVIPFLAAIFADPYFSLVTPEGILSVNILP